MEECDNHTYVVLNGVVDKGLEQLCVVRAGTLAASGRILRQHHLWNQKTSKTSAAGKANSPEKKSDTLCKSDIENVIINTNSIKTIQVLFFCYRSLAITFLLFFLIFSFSFSFFFLHLMGCQSDVVSIINSYLIGTKA